MTSVAILALVLFIIGVLLCFAAAVSAALGRVSPFPLGVGLMGLAWLLTNFPS